MSSVNEITIANVEMANAWDGEEGERWAQDADLYDASGVHLWRAFLATDPIAAGEHVLDVGCGSGKSTRDVARLAAPGQVLGVDLSSQMLDVARRRSAAEGLANVGYLQADAQVYPFDEGRFDVAISCFGAMFFADPIAAFANIGRAVRPGGRLAVLSWRPLAENEWIRALRDALAGFRATRPGRRRLHRHRHRAPRRADRARPRRRPGVRLRAPHGHRQGPDSGPR
jgi:SAM-dependent methyltransferase